MLMEKIESDLKVALKGKDTIKVSTLRFLKSALQNLAIEKRKNLEEKDIVSVIKRHVKQRVDSIDSFTKGNRLDLVEKEALELEILKGYLPEEISQEDLTQIIKGIIGQSQASSLKDMGNIIKLVMAQTKGQADGGRVSSLVRDEILKANKG
jgi:uncharacterized protein